MNKIFIAFIVVFGLSIGCNFFLYYKLGKNQTLLNQANAFIEMQNGAIEKLKIDTQAYTCNLESMEEYARNRYKEFGKELNTCEEKLKDLTNMLEVFNEK